MKTLRCLVVVISLLITMNTLHSQWVKTGGPNGGPVQAIISVGDNILVGTTGGGIHRSPEGSLDWEQLDDNNPLRRFTFSLGARYTPEDTTIFAGTFNNGIHRSTNRGVSWSHIGYDAPGSTFYSILANPFTFTPGSALQHIIAGAHPSGIHISTDNGDNWDTSNVRLTNRNVYTLAASGSNLFAGTRSGVFRSLDSGVSWTPDGLGGKQIFALAVVGSTLYAGTQLDGVYSTTVGVPGDTSWKNIKEGLTNLAVRAFAVSRGNVFAGTGDGVYASDTLTASRWVNISQGMTQFRDPGDTLSGDGVMLAPPQILSLAVSSRYLYAGGQDGYVYRRLLSEITSHVEAERRPQPKAVALERITPNPFASATAITFHIPLRSAVRLSICDPLGREVSILLDEELLPGTYTREWNAVAQADGVYLCRLEAGSYRETRNLLLLR